MRVAYVALLAAAAVPACDRSRGHSAAPAPGQPAEGATPMTDPKTDAEWRAALTPEQ